MRFLTIIELKLRMSDLQERLARCFSLVFPELSREEVPRASQASLAAWDSVASITLLNVVEEEFQIQLDLDVLGDLTSFDLVLDYMQQRTDLA
jgi:acyl carrier protein